MKKLYVLIAIMLIVFTTGTAFVMPNAEAKPIVTVTNTPRSVYVPKVQSPDQLVPHTPKTIGNLLSFYAGQFYEGSTHYYCVDPNEMGPCVWSELRGIFGYVSARYYNNGTCAEVEVANYDPSYGTWGNHRWIVKYHNTFCIPFHLAEDVSYPDINFQTPYWLTFSSNVWYGGPPLYLEHGKWEFPGQGNDGIPWDATGFWRYKSVLPIAIKPDNLIPQSTATPTPTPNPYP